MHLQWPVLFITMLSPVRASRPVFHCPRFLEKDTFDSDLWIQRVALLITQKPALLEAASFLSRPLAEPLD